MATRPTVRGQDPHGLTSVLASAALEWLLIFLLFLNALFSYLVRRFASFFELETPCLLCSRLDHILSGEKPGFYRDLICRSHKFEISSLAYCRTHEKLTNINGMCEGCLFSFATEKKSNCETYESLVGKLGPFLTCCAGEDYDIHPKMPEIAVGDAEGLVKEHLLEDSVLDSAGKKLCSCCNLPLRNKTNSNLLTRLQSLEGEVAKLDPISAATEHCHSIHQDGLKKRRGRPLVSESDLRNHYFDPFSHIGYMEVKITSDSESEAPPSDYDDERSLVHETHETDGCEFIAHCLKPESVNMSIGISCVTASSDLMQEKLIHQSHILELPFPVPQESLHVGETDKVSSQMPSVDGSNHLDTSIKSPTTFSQEKHVDKSALPVVLQPISHEQLTGELHVVSSIASAVAVGNGLEELNWDTVEDRHNPLITSEPMLHELSSLPTLTNSPVGVSSDYSATEGTSVAHVTTERVEHIKLENKFSSIEAQSKNDQPINEPTPSTPDCMDLNDAYKIAVGDRKSLPSGATTEVTTGKGSNHDHKDLRLLLSQISAAQGFDLLWNEMSPTVYAHGDDSRISETSSSVAVQILQKRPSRNESGFDSCEGILQKRLSRNESGFESWDGSIVSEIEGESAIDRLKRQLEKDRKSMNTLYKELEEERSASTIAANQAMAMINKLQEEKATMQMEALQYQRMMEEQAEYDQEAIQKLNELLIQKEKKLQGLDAKTGSHKSRSGTEPMVEKLMGSENDLIGEDKTIDSSLLHSNVRESSLGFEGEKIYISKRLEMLEKKLDLFSNNRVDIDQYKLDLDGNGLIDAKNKDIMFQLDEVQQSLHDVESRNGGFMHEDQLDFNDVKQISCNEELENILAENDSSVPNRDEDVSKATWLMAKPNPSDLYPFAGFDFNPLASGGTDLVAIGDEVLYLKKRLETLEADHNFLECIINSLGNGNEGFQFVQEIASHLRELRRIGIRRREQCVA